MLQTTQAVGRTAVASLPVASEPQASAPPVPAPVTTSAASKPPVYRAVQSNYRTAQSKQPSITTGEPSSMPSQQLNIPFTQSVPDPRHGASFQQTPPVIRFMPATPQQDVQAEPVVSEAASAAASLLQLAEPEDKSAQSTASNGVVNNGKFPVTAEAPGNTEVLQASAMGPNPGQLPEVFPAAISQDTQFHDEQRVDAATDTTRSETKEVNLSQPASGDTQSPASSLQQEALGSPLMPPAAFPKEAAASAADALTQQLLLSPQASIPQTTPFTVAKPLPDEEELPAAGSLQVPDAAATSSPLAQREGSLAQAAAVADAIKQAAQLSAQPAAPGTLHPERMRQAAAPMQIMQ